VAKKVPLRRARPGLRAFGHDHQKRMLGHRQEGL
jgi:hypothetical protein